MMITTYRRTIIIVALFLATSLLVGFKFSEQPTKAGQLKEVTPTKNEQIEDAGQGGDSIPLININSTPLQQQPQMVSLQIHDRSLVIQTYTSPSGDKILLDFICKDYQQLTLHLLETTSNTTLWAKDVKIEGYYRHELKMKGREIGQYNLHILGPKGDHLKQLNILKSG